MALPQSPRSSGRLTKRTVFFTVTALIVGLLAMLVCISIWGNGSEPQVRLMDRAWTLVSGGVGSLLTLLVTRTAGD